MVNWFVVLVCCVELTCMKTSWRVLVNFGKTKSMLVVACCVGDVMCSHGWGISFVSDSRVFCDWLIVVVVVVVITVLCDTHGTCSRTLWYVIWPECSNWAGTLLVVVPSPSFQLCSMVRSVLFLVMLHYPPLWESDSFSFSTRAYRWFYAEGGWLRLTSRTKIGSVINRKYQHGHHCCRTIVVDNASF